MIKLDEDALICDLAETYGIYDYRQLPVKQVAVFCCGLRESSRIKMKMNHQHVPFETLLLSGIADKVNLLLWSKTKDGQKGINRPESISTHLLPEKEKETDIAVFSSGEEFERMRNAIIEKTRKEVRENGNGIS